MKNRATRTPTKIQVPPARANGATLAVMDVTLRPARGADQLPRGDFRGEELPRGAGARSPQPGGFRFAFAKSRRSFGHHRRMTVTDRRDAGSGPNARAAIELLVEALSSGERDLDREGF